MVGMGRLRFGTPEQLEALKALPRRSDGVANYLTEEQRREPGWEVAVRDFLTDIERWEADQLETPLLYFHQRGYLYRFLVEMIPSGSLRRTVLLSFVSFVRQSPVRREDPPQWMVHVREILEMRDAGGPELLLQSGDPAMAAYVRLDALSRH